MKSLNLKTFALLICIFLFAGQSVVFAQTYEEPILTFANGQVRSAWIKQGKKKKAVKVGLKIYYENGQVKREIMSSDGQFFLGNRTSIRKEYYPSGKLKATGAARNIVLNEFGEWKYYYENGQLAAIGDFLSGAQNKKWKYYYPTGQLKAEGSYKLTYLSGGDKLVENKTEFINQNGVVFLINEIDNHLFGRVQTHKDGKQYFTTLALPGVEKQIGEWRYYDEDGVLTKVKDYGFDGEITQSLLYDLDDLRGKRL